LEQTASGVYLKSICTLDTSAFSALGVIDNTNLFIYHQSPKKGQQQLHDSSLNAATIHISYQAYATSMHNKCMYVKHKLQVSLERNSQTHSMPMQFLCCTVHCIHLLAVSKCIAATTMFRNIRIKVIVIWILSASHKNHYKTTTMLKK